MRPKFLILLFVLPLLSGFVDNDSIREELQDDRDRQVIGSGNPLGWEWVEKDDETGYVWIREVESYVDGTSYVAGIFRGGGAVSYTHLTLPTICSV